MAFGMSGLGSHKNTVTTGGAGNSASVSDVSNQSHVVREIQGLKPGQTMSGEVIAKNGSQVQIRIDADTVMTARLEKDINLALGQNMTFEVKSNTGTQLALRPLFENTAQDANSMRALGQAALPVNAKTLSMVSALMEQGMGIDKKTLQSIYKDIMTNKGSKPADVVALHKLQVPVTQENLQQIDNYRNFEHQLLKGIETIAENMKDTLLDMVGGQGSNVQEAAVLLRDMIQIIAGDTTQTLQTPQENGEAITTEQLEKPTGEGSQTVVGNTAKESSTAQISSEGLEAVLKDATGEAATQHSVEPGNTQAALQEHIAQADIQMHQPDSEAKPAVLLIGRDGEPLMTEQQRYVLAGQLEAIGVSKDVADSLRTGQIDAGQLLEHIAQALSKGAADKESLTALLQGKGMQQLLRGQIENNWLLTPQQTADKEAVDKLYTRLREQTGRLAQVLSDAGRGGTELARGVQSLKENVDFIQQLNQNFTYLQLPLKRFGKNAHGDLYVYTNKKNLAKKDGNVSALLHLDMEYLGYMDIYVSMQKERVSTKFYLQKEEMLDFLEANMHILNERLMKRGYTMSTQVVYKEQKANVAAEMMKQEGETSVLSMFSFDVRA